MGWKLCQDKKERESLSLLPLEASFPEEGIKRTHTAVVSTYLIANKNTRRNYE